ncbi:thiol-disulfide isomerase/thioredoxin [Flavobacterium aquaticum]|uniref:Thiol-disulfide isomerase/thioredoxin n=1 Tax=Flavobacterium aquaticum TaxID=1236486 RepID=A0A327YVX8_9FLAO|nr:TlpA disulfide reductase family protein [Flavobacterium aquaticum]RAK23865.1 thiol-disulfide isomerase/thioredoxin [Flavobacterium aquaticum]
MRIYLLFTTLFFSQIISAQNSSKSITLVFKKSNYHFEETSGFKRMNSLINYSEHNSYRETYLSPNNKEKNDTIQLNIESDKIFLIHNWKELNKSSRVILYANDVVEIDYEKGFPNFKIQNRAVKPFDLNLEHQLNLSFPIDNFVFYQTNKRSRNSKEEKEYKTELASFIQSSKVALDELLNLDKISQETYDAQLNYITFYTLNTDTKTNFFDYKNNLQNEELIWLKSYRYFLELYVKNELKIKKYEKEIKDFELKTTNNKTKTKDVSIQYEDSENSFLQIEKSDLFSAKAKEYLLYVYLNRIAKTDSQKLSTYISIFKKHSNDKKLIEGFESAFLVDIEALKQNTSEVVLYDEYKKATTLSSFIEANKGKIIYIDFWASWCAPCRAAFPSSRKLHEEFKEKEIVFLYLSTDANFEAWKKANQFEKLNENSYFIINPKTSEYLKKLAIDFIPRYVLINSNGEISNSKAPSPDSDKIKQELNNLLQSNN